MYAVIVLRRFAHGLLLLRTASCMWASLKRQIGIIASDSGAVFLWPPAEAAVDRGICLSSDGAEVRRATNK